MKTLIIIFLLIYYYFFYLTFFDYHPAQYPQLKERLGTTLWQTANKGPKEEFHTYCYYPGENIIFNNKGGEYIIKQVSGFIDCFGWYGILEVEESFGASEKNKIKW